MSKIYTRGLNTGKRRLIGRDINGVLKTQNIYGRVWTKYRRTKVKSKDGSRKLEGSFFFLQ